AGIQLIDSLQVPGGIQQAEAVILFPDHAEVLPAYAVAERDSLGEAERVLQIEGVVVLIRLARRVALRLPAAGWRTGDEGRQVIKTELAAIAAIKEAVDERAPEFIAKLPVVL